jgi:hypothetical protein
MLSVEVIQRVKLWHNTTVGSNPTYYMRFYLLFNHIVRIPSRLGCL